MRLHPKKKPVVFGGPSLSLTDKDCSDMEFRPPIKFGDLTDLIDTQRPVLITDGLFGSYLSITTRECIDFLDSGGQLLGASSMGALRAADCLYNGMVGVGHVYHGYHLGHFTSDADVAVKYDPTGTIEMTISIAHLDSILNHLVHTQHLSHVAARKAFRDGRQVMWHLRTVEATADILKFYLNYPQLATIETLLQDPELNPKKTDARMATQLLRRYYLSQRGSW